jgi:hypothetical protein
MPKTSINYHISLNQTNVIKGVAICAMLWHHLFVGSQEFGVGVERIAATCKVCVALFVFLSGYGLTIQFEKKAFLGWKNKTMHVTRFMLRRFTKFYLNYWIIFILFVPLGVFVFGRTPSIAYGENTPAAANLLLDFLGLQGLNSYNITWWFNRLILCLYVSFPFFYWAMKSKLVFPWMLALLYFDPGSILYPLRFVADGLDVYIITFALGICTAAHKEGLNKALHKINAYVVLCILFVIAATFLYLRNSGVFDDSNGFGADPLATVPLVFFIVMLSSLFNMKFSLLAFFGRHAMNIFLLHTFIFSYFFHSFIYSFENPFLIFFALLCSSLLLSIILEFLKKHLGFYKLQDKICEKIENY